MSGKREDWKGQRISSFEPRGNFLVLRNPRNANLTLSPLPYGPAIILQCACLSIGLPDLKTAMDVGPATPAGLGQQKRPRVSEENRKRAVRA